MFNVFEISADFLFDESTDSFEIDNRNKKLADKIRLIDKPEERDQDALIQIIKSMLTKQEIKDILNQHTSVSA
ncbi:MAG: hypothetical protein ACOC2H_02715 [Spirochaetota bacterium]